MLVEVRVTGQSSNSKSKPHWTTYGNRDSGNANAVERGNHSSTCAPARDQCSSKHWEPLEEAAAGRLSLLTRTNAQPQRTPTRGCDWRKAWKDHVARGWPPNHPPPSPFLPKGRPLGDWWCVTNRE